MSNLTFLKSVELSCGDSTIRQLKSVSKQPTSSLELPLSCIPVERLVKREREGEGWGGREGRNMREGEKVFCSQVVPGVLSNKYHPLSPATTHIHSHSLAHMQVASHICLPPGSAWLPHTSGHSLHNQISLIRPSCCVTLHLLPCNDTRNEIWAQMCTNKFVCFASTFCL